MKNILIAITGASGSIYAKQLIEILLKEERFSLHALYSRNSDDIWKQEIGGCPLEYFSQKGVSFIDNYNFFTPFASGSNPADAMVIIPCSMGCLGRIASGVSDDMITRIADVQLKERKPLIIVPRESPLNLVHLRNMTSLSEAGAIIAPASPSFYNRPTSIEEMAKNFALRIIDLLGIETGINDHRWMKDKI